MIGLVRKIVAGPKNRTQWNGIDLDLTYITDKIIAMAFPASGFEKTYRNSINDVSAYFKEKHEGNFLVINLSMRLYDYGMFSSSVKDYFWPDHQAPPLSTLFLICLDMLEFLTKSSKNVVAVHCNHGKGRTGTCIIAFMLFTHRFKTAEQALAFYNKRRFIVSTYGVDQPCQRRYLGYVENTLRAVELPHKLRAFRLVKIMQTGLSANDFYLQVSLTRTCETRHTKLKINQIIKNNQIPLIGDIFIQLFSEGWIGEKQAARINFNLEFLHRKKDGTYWVEFRSEAIKVNGGLKNSFTLALFFEEFCQCHQDQNAGCECCSDRAREQAQWAKLLKAVQVSRGLLKEPPQNLSYLNSNQQSISRESGAYEGEPIRQFYQ